MGLECNATVLLGEVMKMEIYECGPITVVKPCERRLDAARAVGFKATMHEIVEKSGTAHIVLDMSRIDFMDSSGLGALIAVLKRMSPDNKFEVSGLTAPVQRVFDLTRMDHVFKVYKTIDDAVAGVRKKAG